MSSDRMPDVKQSDTTITRIRSRKRNKTRNKNSSIRQTHTQQSQIVNNNDLAIPANIDIRLAYKRKKMKHKLFKANHITVTDADIVELKQILGSKKWQMYGNEEIALFKKCVVCEDVCTNGELAVETVLFIPKKNDPAYDKLNLGRFRYDLPRVCCDVCSREDGYVRPANEQSTIPIAAAWGGFLNSSEVEQEVNEEQAKKGQDSDQTHKTQVSTVNAIAGKTVLKDESASVSVKTDTQNQKDLISVAGSTLKSKNNTHKFIDLRESVIPPMYVTNNPVPADTKKPGENPPMQSFQDYNRLISQATHRMGGVSINENADKGLGLYKDTLPAYETNRDPFHDGFLICTQLVKTGGADQGGLQVGDVFVEFGQYRKIRFPGLKAIANLVRRSAGKEICVVVWRKLEQQVNNATEDDGTGRTVFQKLALSLKPLQSHDADGGGVLGSVINTYPLPEMRN